VDCDGCKAYYDQYCGKNLSAVPAAEEETLRKVGKQIENMIKDFEASFDVRDKQDALAMCALKLGANAEVSRLANENNINASTERVHQLNRFLEELENN